MPPNLRRKGEPPPDYGTASDLFSIEIHHGGLFVGQDVNRAYIDEKVDWFDYCEVDTWSALWLDDFALELGYEKNSSLKTYWLLPDKTLSDGLRIISSDADTIIMAQIVEKVRNFVLYFDHDDNVVGINWDDIVANPISDLPKVFGPDKVHIRTGEKLPDFYSSARQMRDETIEGSSRKQQTEREEANGDNSESDDGDDSDFVDSEYELDLEDDDLFANNVDAEVVDEGVAKGKKIGNGSRSDSSSNVQGKHMEELSSDEDGLQAPDSDEEGEPRFKFKSFNNEDMENPVFKVGMVFSSAPLLRNAITEYSLKHRVEIKMSRNEKKRIHAHCVEGCPWDLNASSDSRSSGLMVKRYVGEHNCQKQWVLQRCTSNWLAEKYLETFRADDKMSLTNFAKIVQKDWNLTPSRTKLARARRLAMKEIYGDEVQQYNMLWDYAKELRRTNPGSTFYLNLLGSRFHTLYMSLDACKRGFLAGCRPLICLDGCHIKTKFGGQLLCAVGIDPNDCIYPIALGVVEVESFKTWKWFLEALKQDLGIDNTYPWTIMTDKQKGLIPAVQHVFPESEHRHCVRHLYQNFQQHFKGENLKNQLWACARSSSVVEWNRNMDKMKALNQDAWEWLEKMPPNTWARAFFSTFPKCDILLNNSCEVFNKYILDAREMPVLSMLERIKSQLMARHYNKANEVGEVWMGASCPKIRNKVQKNAELANTCYAVPAGQGTFQVQDKNFQYIVNIITRECDCRRWDLTGVPCSHAVACLRHERIPTESVLHACYSTETYLSAYSHTIWPCRDKTTWEKVNATEVLPPIYSKKVGRPAKNRRKHPFEKEGPNGPTMSRHGVVMTCRYCGVSGHNSAGCGLKKAGVRPKLQPRRVGHATEQIVADEEPVITQETMHGAEDFNLFDTSEHVLSQVTNKMLSQMEAQVLQSSRVRMEPQPLPDPVFIMSNQPTARPVPPTTATKEGKSRMTKRKPAETKAGEPKKKAPAKKS